MAPEYVRFFRDIRLDDAALVGGKNAYLGEMYSRLTPIGVLVPNGFAITADAYRHVLESAGAWPRLHDTLDGLERDDAGALARRGRQAREILLGAPLPDDLQAEILAAYHRLQDECGPDPAVAVRSSATAEGLPAASFAGQQDSYLNIRGDTAFLDACRRCFASLFTDRAIHYRIDRGFDHFDIALSIGVMRMVRSDLASSGEMFTLDTESGCRDVVFITAAYGLGENVVQGTVDTDEFYVHKPTFLKGYRAVLRRVLGEKQVKMVYSDGRTREPTRNIPTPRRDRERFCITDEDVLTLAGYAMKIERHYSADSRLDQPMDIEWAKDGLDGRLYIVQARPESVASRRETDRVEEYMLENTGTVLATGRAAGNRIAAGAVRVVPSVARLEEFRCGEVLVADSTTPDWEPVMKRAAAVVTNRGGRTCHTAIVARELGIPAVVGAEGATESLTNGQTVTVSCAGGDVGKVYDGAIPFEVKTIDLAALGATETRIMVNAGDPDVAFKTSRIPNDGVGLARVEFIIRESIGVHPMALVHPERVEDAEERRSIASLTARYDRPADFFVERLSEGIGTIAAAFHPRPVIVRLSDLKTGEYASLLGGKAFEPRESNPMLGFRGASRYAHPAYADGFALECAAMRRVRDEMGLYNVKLMVPFCRRVQEGRKVLQLMAEHGLRRGENGLEIYVMCEVPNNIMEIDAFAAIFDGFSIGSNDLTQLTLGVDRNSELVAFEFDERDPGVKEMVRLAVEGAHRNGRHCGICGQAPSDYPDMAEYLVRLGIDSLSLNADSLIRVRMRVIEIEKQLRGSGTS